MRKINSLLKQCRVPISKSFLKIILLSAIVLKYDNVETKNINYKFKTEVLIDVIPDQKTAISIATAIWLPIFGKDIYNQKPFKAELIGDSVWHVKSTLGKHKVGGTYYIDILKRNCKVLNVGGSK